jgi:hypothetical protein
MDARSPRRRQGNHGERRRTGRCALIGVLLAGARLVGAGRMQDTVLDMTQVSAPHHTLGSPARVDAQTLDASVTLDGSSQRVRVGAQGEVLECRPRR